MAIIYTYPKKSSVEANDTFIITDSDDNSTKVVTAQELANYIDETITLQEVLDTGNAAYYSATTIPATVGNIILGNTSGLGVKSTTIELDGQTGDVDLFKNVNGSTGNLTVGGNIAGNSGLLTLTDGADILSLLADDSGLTNQSSIFSNQGLTLGSLAFGMTVTSTGLLNVTSTSTMSFDSGNSNINMASGTGDIFIGNPGTGVADQVSIGATNNVLLQSNNSNVRILANNGQVNIGEVGNETNSILMSTNGNITLDFNAGGFVTSNGEYQTANGLASAPAYSFNIDSDTGFYLEAAGRPAISAGGNNIVQAWASGVKLSQPLLLQNAALPGTNTYEEFTFFESGTWEPILVDGITPVAGGLTYTSQGGTYTIINNTVYGSFKIVATAAVPIPIAILGVRGDILSGTGSGNNLFAQYLVDSQYGSTVTIGNTGTFNTATGYPVGGFVSTTAAQGLVLQTFVSGTEYRKVSANPTLGANTTIEGTFVYNRI